MTINAEHDMALFKSEYELDLEARLRHRFRPVCWFYLALNVVVLAFRVMITTGGQRPGWVAALLVHVGTTLLGIAIICYFLFGRVWKHANRAQLLKAASNLILLLGLVSMLRSITMAYAAPSFQTDVVFPLFFAHLVACLFLPWSPVESVRPFVPLLGLWAVGELALGDGSLGSRIAGVVLSPLILAPGLLICWLRLRQHHEDFHTRMFSKLFHSLRNDIAQARSIHESLFPKPFDDGHVRLTYVYAPMRDIGGDFIHMHAGPDGRLDVVLIDVTGHGLAAALTVNRLYGELERIRAESPHADPGEVLSLLNRYIHLTMARHCIFVTALAVTVDPANSRLLWASAGHPPAFLRGANGAVRELAATTVLLGATEAAAYSPDPQVLELSPGDTLIMYTDGAYEARDRTNRMLGLKRLANLMNTEPAPSDWPTFIARSVQRHSGGRAEDDVLVAAITFLAVRSRVAGARSATFAAT